MIEAQQLKKIIEGALFAAGKPLTAKDLAELIDESERPAPGEITEALNQLMAEYEERGVRLHKLSTGYCFRVQDDLGPWVTKLWDEKPARYTRAFLETLAIIAYRQPITRGEIESIRGVAVSANIIKTLQERDWIRIVGHKDVPGKPALLATTKDFLNYFNLKRLEDLPPLAEIKDLDEAAAMLEHEALEHEALEQEGLEHEGLEHEEINEIVIVSNSDDDLEEVVVQG
jgi:segregation and condensation protein B